jgi:hypothetical protein
MKDHCDTWGTMGSLGSGEVRWKTSEEAGFLVQVRFPYISQETGQRGRNDVDYLPILCGHSTECFLFFYSFTSQDFFDSQDF